MIVVPCCSCCVPPCPPATTTGVYYKYQKMRIQCLKQKDYQFIDWQQLRLRGAKNRTDDPLECVHVAVVVIVVYYLAATVRQTREHIYVSFARPFMAIFNMIYVAGSRHDCICYSYITKPTGARWRGRYLNLLHSRVWISWALLHKTFFTVSSPVVPSGHTHCQPNSHVVNAKKLQQCVQC